MLRRYLDAWCPIIASRWTGTGATFIDAFAGPGEYDDGGDGSPVIALRSASRSEVTKHPTDMRLVFIESHRGRYEHLVRRIATLGPQKSHTKVHLVYGPCGEVMLPAIHKVGADAGPLFVNFDGWGADTPYYLVTAVGARPSSEVLITFQAQFFYRFADLEQIDTGDRFFGGTAWREVRDQPASAKRRFLVEHYLRRLNDAGFPYTLTFEMLDEGGHSLFLVFGTSNDLGLSRMKDAMWTIDKVRGERFQDPRDINQGTFDIADSPDLGLLQQQILARLEGGPRTMEELKRFALLETVFKETHVKPAVTSLRERGQVDVDAGRGHDRTVVRLAQLLRLPI